MKKVILAGLVLLSSCIAVIGSRETEDSPASTMPILASALTAFRPPAQSDYFSVTESSMEVPARILGAYVPVGKILDIGLNRERLAEALGENRAIPGGQVIFSERNLARIEYSFDADALRDAGLMGELNVFYFEEKTQEWKPVDRVEIDHENSKVIALTSHLTPFVLTAGATTSTSSVPDAPACIAADYPSGVGGTSGAQFMTVGSNFQYLADRDYYVIPNQDFVDLGFAGALGIATLNGDQFVAPLWTSHKRYTGDNYIQFTAHDDITVFIMYDTRGGVTLSDDSADAPWIASSGFTNTGKFIRTNDAVQQYRVYKNDYSKGQLVSLHGNRKGVVTAAIDTNYWVVIKRKGLSGQSLATDLCNGSPVFKAPEPVQNLRGIPGRTGSLLVWQNPDRPDFQGVVVRRSTLTPPAIVTDGVAPGGSSPNPQTYSDAGLTNNTTYFYSVFALYSGSPAQPLASVALATSNDNDSDGISTVYENAFNYPSGNPTAFNKQDTDNDGTDDRTEIINGTDPTNGDATAPTLSDFTRTSSSPTFHPFVTFTIDSLSPDVTGWLVSTADTTPRADDSRWTATKPTNFTLGTSANHTLYAWVKDAAGNVSAPGFFQVDLDGIRVTEAAYLGHWMDGTGINAIQKYVVNLANGRLTTDFNYPVLADAEVIAIHPKGGFLYVHVNPPGSPTGSILVYKINSDGLVLLQTLAAQPRFASLSIHPDGRYMYALETGRTYSYLIEIDPTNGNLTPRGTTGNIPHLIDAEAGFKFDPRVNKAWAIFRYANVNDYVFWQDYNPTTGQLSGYNSALAVTVTNAAVRSSFAINPYQDSSYLAGDNQIRGVKGNYEGAGTISLASNQKISSMVHSEAGYLYAVDPTSRTIHKVSIAANGNLAGSTPYTFVDSVEKLYIDPSGQRMYGLGKGQKVFVVYRLNQADGSPIHEQTFSLATHNPRSMVLKTVLTTNEPPLVKTRLSMSHFSPYYYYFPTWGVVNEIVQLIGDASTDPDSVRCNANPALYQYRWVLLNKPAASTRQLGTANITNFDKMIAGFIPDAPGQYDFDFTFTDDPGTCERTPRSSSQIVTMTAGYMHSNATQINSNQDLGSLLAQYPAPRWSIQTSYQNIGNLNRIWCIGPWMCAPVCDRYEMEKGQAYAECDSQTGGIAGIDTWTQLYQRRFITIQWLTLTP